MSRDVTSGGRDSPPMAKPRPPVAPRDKDTSSFNHLLQCVLPRGWRMIRVNIQGTPSNYLPIIHAVINGLILTPREGQPGRIWVAFTAPYSQLLRGLGDPRGSLHQ